MPSLLKRLLIYQNERFPIAVHGLLIAAFSFSAIGYSRLCRGAAGFISWKFYACCVLTNFTLFFLLRVSDEHKDAADDVKYRSYLPVPRGLISLKELRIVAFLLLGIATLVNILYFPALLPLFGAMMGYLLLMRYEFFIAGWLRLHQLWYNLSHMLIIPLADMYASGYDWKPAGAGPPHGLLYFFGVSYLNGTVLEVGRKIRTEEKEEPGVISYTGLWGRKAAPAVWMSLLAINCALAMLAFKTANGAAHPGLLIILLSLFALSLVPAIAFVIKPKTVFAKSIEIASLAWALGMYLLLGGIPQALQLVHHS